jgi:hypothetical protein
LREDLGVLDVVEGGGGDDAVDLFEPESFEGTLTDVDAPDAGIDGHGWTTPRTVDQHGTPAEPELGRRRTPRGDVVSPQMEKATTPFVGLSIIITGVGKGCWRNK